MKHGKIPLKKLIIINGKCIFEILRKTSESLCLFLHHIGVLEWILGIRTGKWMGFLTRETMEKAGSYQEAVAMLSQTEMLAPAYFIVGGNKSGEVSTINF